MALPEPADRLGQNRDEDAGFHVFVSFFECRHLAAFRTFPRFEITPDRPVAALARMTGPATMQQNVIQCRAQVVLDRFIPGAFWHGRAETFFEAFDMGFEPPIHFLPPKSDLPF